MLSERMSVYHWILLGGFTVCFIFCAWQFIHVLRKTRIRQYSDSLGNPFPGILFSFTGAMFPSKKETAFLHLPTYAAGLLFHLGTFLGFIVMVLLFFDAVPGFWLSYIMAGFLIITMACGISILLKRTLMKKMRSLSSPDDYFSNILVSLFHGFSAVTLLKTTVEPFLFIYTTILLLYIPVGKLRHMVYFFTSRIHLGIFFGWRGVWPVKKDEI